MLYQQGRRAVRYVAKVNERFHPPRYYSFVGGPFDSASEARAWLDERPYLSEHIVVYSEDPSELGQMDFIDACISKFEEVERDFIRALPFLPLDKPFDLSFSVSRINEMGVDVSRDRIGAAAKLMPGFNASPKVGEYVVSGAVYGYLRGG